MFVVVRASLPLGLEWTVFGLDSSRGGSRLCFRVLDGGGCLHVLYSYSVGVKPGWKVKAYHSYQSGRKRKLGPRFT